ncbi:TerC family protein [Exiguobacterium sp. SH4S7]|uniref:TerC family protein n=1 Tax=Exiguobacterium sp. SH4S7 TaxID=2510958 RepID=UPI00104040E7|nr:TerC family protein [Exiguobacterium sp. SH4S7]TCI36290.1 TerC family protein [Exiguobacterium sp. SH4S7]
MTLLIAFLALVIFMLALDLGVFHRKAHEVSLREAWTWTFVWIGIAIAFGGWLFYSQGSTVATEYASVYFIEKALAIDNVFVFSLVFAYFAIPLKYQHKVLFWGILGAILFRAIFIVAGVSLLENFGWVYYVFGAFLVYTGWMMFKNIGKDESLEDNKTINWLKNHLPLTQDMSSGKFTKRINGKLFFTPLFIALIFIELSDIVFAVDSVAASFAYSRDPYIIFYANIMAILGLRSLYFVLANLIDRFYYLKHGLSFMLVFIGTKMIFGDVYKMPIWMSLGAIVLVILISVVYSFYKTKPNSQKNVS